MRHSTTGSQPGGRRFKSCPRRRYRFRVGLNGLHRSKPKAVTTIYWPPSEVQTVRVGSWLWLPLGLGVVVLVWAVFVVILVLAGRRDEARSLARFIPDCLVLFGRLIADPRVPRRRKLLFLGLVGYLAMPFDLVPDFIPIAGQLDDVIVVAIVLRSFLRSGGEPLVRELWPGPDDSLRLVLRAAGR